MNKKELLNIKKELMNNEFFNDTIENSDKYEIYDTLKFLIIDIIDYINKGDKYDE